MQYIPELSAKEIEKNHKCFNERLVLYRKKELDFVENRKFILKKAGHLQGRILEIGAGTGYITLALAKAGYKFISIDKDKEVLKTAALNLAYQRVLSNVEFHIMDGKSMDFGNESFENIVCVNLFHHVNKINKMLSKEIIRSPSLTRWLVRKNKQSLLFLHHNERRGWGMSSIKYFCID